jgi:hypothetical protein
MSTLYYTVHCQKGLPKEEAHMAEPKRVSYSELLVVYSKMNHDKLYVKM